MGLASMPASIGRLINELSQVQRILGSRAAARYLGCVFARMPQVVASSSLGPADGMMTSPLTVRTAKGQIQILSGDFGVVREIFGSRCYDFADWISRSRSYLDLGANEGLFSLYALAADPANHVTAIEVQAPLCERLKTNLRRNGYDERARVIWGLAGGTNSQLEKLAETGALVNMEDLLSELGPIDFLKVDIEGSEFALFADCGGWIQNVHFVAMEVHHDCGDSQAMKQLLRGHGLEVCHERTHRDLGYLFLENKGFAG